MSMRFNGVISISANDGLGATGWHYSSFPRCSTDLALFSIQFLFLAMVLDLLCKVWQHTGTRSSLLV